MKNILRPFFGIVLLLFFQLPIQGQEDEKPIIYKLKHGYPRPPGGEKALRQFLLNNIKVPVELIKKGGNAKVITVCTITRAGEVGDIDIIHSEDPLCAEETKRVLKMMYKWTPGTANRKSASTMAVFTFYFATNRDRLPYDEILTYSDSLLIKKHTIPFEQEDDSERPNKRIQSMDPILIVDYWKTDKKSKKR